MSVWVEWSIRRVFEQSAEQRRCARNDVDRVARCCLLKFIR